MCENNLLSLDEKHLFRRDFERKDGTVLSVNQCSIGDVGCVVWDAAIVLSSYLETGNFKIMENGVSQSVLQCKNIVELGAGTGIVGMNACCEGANVVVTDLSEFVPLMNLNLEENKGQFQGSISARELRWGSNVDQFTPHPDYILLADCIYYEESLEPLVQTISDLSGPDTVVLCCYEERLTGNKPQLQKKFFELISTIFDTEEVPLERQDPVYRSEDIHIIQFTKKR